MPSHNKSMSSSSFPNKVRLGIVGLGLMGTAHARSILNGQVPGCELAAICDQRKDTASGFPDIPFFSEPAAMLRSGKIDAVLINYVAIGIRAGDDNAAELPDLFDRLPDLEVCISGTTHLLSPSKITRIFDARSAPRSARYSQVS